MPIEHGSSASLRERAFTALVGSMADAALSWTLDGSILSCNPAAERLLQRSSRELLGQPVSLLCLPGDQDGLDALLARRVQPSAWRDIVLRRPDGKALPVSARLFVFSDEEGRPAGVCMLVRPRSALAEGAAEELERFSSAAAHDLLEPLRKITAFSELLKRQSAAVLDGKSLDFIERIRSAAARMTRLIEDVAAYSRTLTDQGPFERVELKDVLAEALRALEPRLRRVQAQVEVGELPAVLGNSAALRRLFQALLDNALKFQPPASRPQARVDFRRPRPGLVEISIADNGIGLEPKDARRIFEPFQRLHTRAEYEGSGLSLAGCRRIARSHGGDIAVVSEKGKGAAFLVTLPEAPR